jgi:hypothetical protein
MIDHGAERLLHVSSDLLKESRFSENKSRNPVCFVFSGPELAYPCRSRKCAKRARGLIVTTGYSSAGFAIKAGYYILAAVTVVFVAMLVLTVLHP